MFNLIMLLEDEYHLKVLTMNTRVGHRLANSISVQVQRFIPEIRVLMEIEGPFSAMKQAWLIIIPNTHCL